MTTSFLAKRGSFSEQIQFCGVFKVYILDCLVINFEFN
jgi:hypothetical protein